MTRIKTYGLMLATLVVLLDQAVKYAMIVPLSLQSKGTIYLLPIFSLTWAENKGVSMGMFQAGTDAQRWMLVALTGVLALAVLVWMWRERRLGDVLVLARFWAARSAISSIGRASAMSWIMPISMSVASAPSSSSIWPMPVSPSAS